MDGPITIQKIMDEAEKIGIKLGIPRDQAIIYARVEHMARNLDKFNEENRAWRAEQERKDREDHKDKWHFIRNVVRSIDGLLDRFIGK